MRIAAVVFLGMALSTAVSADDRSILFDEEVDFSSFKTFVMAAGTVDSERPELKSPIALKRFSDAIRNTLVAHRLKEQADRPDLTTEFVVTSVDFGIGPFGRANPVGRSGRRGAQALPVDFTEATLVIDLKITTTGQLVWRGVFRDDEKSAQKLAETVVKGAGRLLADYPPKKNK